MKRKILFFLVGLIPLTTFSQTPVAPYRDEAAAYSAEQRMEMERAWLARQNELPPQRVPNECVGVESYRCANQIPEQPQRIFVEPAK